MLPLAPIADARLLSSDCRYQLAMRVDFQVNSRHQLVTRVDFQVNGRHQLITRVDFQVDVRHQLATRVNLDAAGNSRPQPDKGRQDLALRAKHGLEVDVGCSEGCVNGFCGLNPLKRP
jgi:hypothetical protein